MQENATRDKKEADKKSEESSSNSDQSEYDDEVIIRNRRMSKEPPKLLEAVIQALPQNSPAAQLLTRGSRKKRRVGPAPAEMKVECEITRQKSEDTTDDFGNLTDNEKEMLKIARSSIKNVKCDVHREMS